MAIPDEIRLYLENLLKEAQIEVVDAATKETMLQDLFVSLDDYIIDKVVDHLPVDKLDDFTAFMQQKPAREQVERYLQENVPNTQDLFTVAFADFRENYLKAVHDAKQQTPHIL